MRGRFGVWGGWSWVGWMGFEEKKGGVGGMMMLRGPSDGMDFEHQKLWRRREKERERERTKTQLRGIVE